METKEKLMTTQEVAIYLDYTVAAIGNYYQSGKIEGEKKRFGSVQKVLYKKSVVDNFKFPFCEKLSMNKLKELIKEGHDLKSVIKKYKGAGRSRLFGKWIRAKKELGSNVNIYKVIDENKPTTNKTKKIKNKKCIRCVWGKNRKAGEKIKVFCMFKKCFNKKNNQSETL